MLVSWISLGISVAGIGMGLLARTAAGATEAGPIEVMSLLGSDGGVGELDDVCTLLLGRLPASCWFCVTMGEVEGLCRWRGERGCVEWY